MPIFALANAGIDLRGLELTEIVLSPISLGIVFGLFIGKPLGVFLASFFAVKWFGVQLPKGINWLNITGVGFLAGIGFTMSLFISGLALPQELEVYSKTGIVTGSILSGIVGSLVLYFDIKRK
ncbi:MAG: Na+/H+ antiporter NhaA [Bdellovibrionales bacterium]